MTVPASPNSEFERLAHVSRRLGRNVAYVQGGGGNTSIKIDEGRMWVKASGTELAAAQTDNGFVAVDYERIRQGLATCTTEADYTALVKASILEHNSERPGRPSIETGFHALLPPATVLHSHSVLANVLTCAQEGEDLCRILLPEAIWIPYASPGLPVTASIKDRLAAAGTELQTVVLMLQNHGIVVAAETPDAAWRLHEDVNATILQHFDLAEPDLKTTPFFDADATHLLFPDQAVYLGHESLRRSKAGEETQQAYNFLRFVMDERHLTPDFLPSGEADFLLNMESEKYRQKVFAS
ncbi:class II aldolase [Asaia spathodeae]|uniref:class II aldolase/adducin family protein n=1 Tax=Asaia spathodeae TaxID=657016 RepID=UPI002FC314B7